jgi:DNA-binding CsgD family transcriptional regulator
VAPGDNARMRGRRRPTGLTEREREVLAFIRVGLTNEEIAGRLGITLDGAKYHVSQILQKLGVASREEAAALPDERTAPWWARALAWSAAAKVALAAGAVASVAAVGVLTWAVATTGSGDLEEGRVLETSTSAAPATPPPTPSPVLFLPIPWLDSTPAPFATGSPPPTPDPSVLAFAECRGDQLDGAFTGSAFQGGYTFVDFVIANVSPEPCRLSGALASFRYLGADGGLLFSGAQAKCDPQPCSQAILAPNGAVDSPSDDAGAAASRALFRVRGYDPAPNACDGPGAVDEISLELPGGGTLTIPASESGKCLGPDLGPFVPEVQTIIPPTAPPVALVTAAQVPSKAAAGQDMNFTVEITNVSDTPFSFGDTCPNYALIIGNKAVDDTHNLNCHVSPTIASGAHVLFAMKATLPAGLEPGSYDVSWTLDAAYASPDAASYQLQVIAP